MPKELATFVTAMNRVAVTFPTFSQPADVDCSSILWRGIVFALPALKAPLKTILASISIPRARDNNKTELWTDPEKFPSMENAQLAIMAVESDLAEELKKSKPPWSNDHRGSHGHFSSQTAQNAKSEIR